MKPPSFKRLILICFLVLFALGLMILASNLWISGSRQYCHDELAHLPDKKVGLLLGTSKYRVGGSINLYYQYRLEAAVRLFQSGKIQFILVSGDNSTRSYNEPSTFREDLLEAGIPEERIYLDYAGFRTLDSVVRCKKVFGENDIIVISQGFHNERAVFIARHEQMEAHGFNARDVGWAFGWRIHVREVLARVKTVLDLYVLNTQPHFLGEEIPIK